MIEKGYRIYTYMGGDNRKCKLGWFLQETNIQKILKIKFADLFFFPSSVPLPNWLFYIEFCFLQNDCAGSIKNSVGSHNGAVFLSLGHLLIIFLFHVGKSLELVWVFKLDWFMAFYAFGAGQFVLAIDCFLAVHALCFWLESALPREWFLGAHDIGGQGIVGRQLVDLKWSSFLNTRGRHKFL